MWAEAAKWVAKYSEGVVTAVDAEGYPVSVRQLSLPYDAPTGTMPVTFPEVLGAVEGSANLLCHFHDDHLWNLTAILLKGKLERRSGGWVFVTTAFTPPSMWQMMKNIRRSTKSYLQKRGLETPVVDYDAIEKMWERAKRIQK